MAVGITASHSLDSNALPFYPPSFPHSSIDHDLLNEIIAKRSSSQLLDRRRAKKQHQQQQQQNSRSFSVQSQSSWSISTALGSLSLSHHLDEVDISLASDIAASASPAVIDGMEEPSPFRMLLRDGEALDMWNQFVEMPEDEQSQLLDQLETSSSAVPLPITQSANSVEQIAPRTPSRFPIQIPKTPIFPRHELNLLQLEDEPNSSSGSARKKPGRRKRRQRLDSEGCIFSMEMNDADTTSAFDLFSPSRSTRSSIPDLLPPPSPSLVSGSSRNSIDASPGLRPVKFIPCPVQISLLPSYAFKQQYDEHKKEKVNTCLSPQPPPAPPLWLQRLKNIQVSDSSWSLLRAFETKIRDVIEDVACGSSSFSRYEDWTINNDDELVRVDTKHARMGLRIHSKDAFSSCFETCLHSMANYYRLSHDIETIGKGRKKYIEGWIYFPKPKKNGSSHSSATLHSSHNPPSSGGSTTKQKRRSLPDIWFVDVASRSLSSKK